MSKNRSDTPDTRADEIAKKARISREDILKTTAAYQKWLEEYNADLDSIDGALNTMFDAQWENTCKREAIDACRWIDDIFVIVKVVKRRSWEFIIQCIADRTKHDAEKLILYIILDVCGGLSKAKLKEKIEAYQATGEFASLSWQYISLGISSLIRQEGRRECAEKFPKNCPWPKTVLRAEQSQLSTQKKPEPTLRTTHHPSWIKDYFSHQQYRLLSKLWTCDDVAATELIVLLNYTDPESAFDNLRRRVTETNKGLCEKQSRIGEAWEIRQRTRDNVLYYLLRKVMS